MNDGRKVPGLTLVCGLPGGKGKRHGRTVAVVGLVDGALEGTVVLGVTNRGEERWRILVGGCVKHGVLMFRERDAIEALERGQKALELTERPPGMKIRRSLPHSV